MTTPITVSSPAAAKAVHASIVPGIGERLSGAVTSTASAMPGDQPENSPWALRSASVRINSPRDSPRASRETGTQSTMTWTMSITQTTGWAGD